MTKPGVLRGSAAVLSLGTLLGFGCGKSTDSHGAGPSVAGQAASSGASTTTAGNGTAGASAPDGGAPATDAAGAAGAPGCVNLECQVPLCPAGSTTIRGKVYAPNGSLPLYNVSVFVPNAALPDFSPQPACDRCGEHDVPSVVRTTTDETGAFVLENAPAGNDIPLVMQVGRWRRAVTIPVVQACVETELSDPDVTRLPRNQQEGDLPRIALVAGAGDQLECFPRRLGIDDAEFTTSAGQGRIHLFAGAANAQTPGITQFDASLNAGAALPPATELWASAQSLQQYDLVMLGCEGFTAQQEKPTAARQAVYDYLSGGGRVLASHWQHIWLSNGPAPLPTIATWQDRQDPSPEGATITSTVNQTFPKGKALATWLVNALASTTPGQLDVSYPRDNVQAVNPALAREWLSVENPNYPELPKAIECLSFTTPVGAAAGEACGRGAFTDLHVSGTTLGTGTPPPGFPLNCEERELSGQEKAITFLLLDLANCIAPADVP